MFTLSNSFLVLVSSSFSSSSSSIVSKGMDYRLAAFLIPWGVILYTASGGLQATFLASYIHTVIIFMILILMVFVVYIKVYSADQIYTFLDATVVSFIYISIRQEAFTCITAYHLLTQFSFSFWLYSRIRQNNVNKFIPGIIPLSLHFMLKECTHVVKLRATMMVPI